MSSIIKVDTIQTAAGGTPTAADLGLNTTGSVLQVVEERYTARVSTSSTGWSTTGFTVSITPKSTNSKILVSLHMGAVSNSTDDGAAYFKFYRDGVVLPDSFGPDDGNRPGVAFGARPSGLYRYQTVSMQMLDSPSTTNSTEYQLWWRIPSYGAAFTNSRGGYVDNTETPRAITTFILTEIAG
jgi:hypothetical protein